MKVHALGALQIKALPKRKYADGQGLWLWKSRKEAGQWVVRLVVSGRRREMGLGRWPDVGIAEARERAGIARKKVRDGIDERHRARYKAKRLTVAEAIKGCFEAKQAELKSDGKAGRWMSPMSVHIIPKIGKQAIEDVDQHMIKQVLEPIWHTKPDSARKAMNRLNMTLKHAAALGLNVDLQAPMKAGALLGKRRHEVQHIPSLPYSDAPAFYKMLCKEDAVSCLALRFLILTLAQTSEVRFAHVGEIAGDVWTLPPGRTKTTREHRIPLVAEAKKVIELARKTDDQKLLFPSPTKKALSDAAMARFMEREGYVARPHGFRATFRTWVDEQTDTDYETKEAALGHVVDTEVVRAYQRSNRIDKRKILLQQWVDFLLA
jgi:integrase